MEPSVFVLILQQDAAERQLIESVLRSFNARAESLTDSARAAELINTRKFDGVFVDGELPKGKSLQLVQQVRQSPSNSKAPIVFITDENHSVLVREAFAAGVTFFLTRPLDQKKVERLLNVTRGAMLAERRGYYRIPIQAPVRFTTGKKSAEGTSVNISRSGILIEAGGRLAQGDTVEMTIDLPKPGRQIRAVGEVVRVDEQGRAGIHFTRLAAADIEALQNFIGI